MHADLDEQTQECVIRAIERSVAALSAKAAPCPRLRTCGFEPSTPWCGSQPRRSGFCRSTSGWRLVGGLVAWVGPWTSLHGRALRNLAVAFPDRSEAERKRVATAMWRNTGRTIAETMMLQRILSDPSRLEIDGREELQRHLRAPGANIGVTLHMGNWEITGIACGICGGKLAGVYRPLRNPYLDRYLRRTRTPLYPAGLLFKAPTRGTMSIDSAAIAAINLLRSGGHLGVVCDQVDETCVFTVPFFGQEAKFTPAPAVFARNASARIWIARCLRRDGQFAVHRRGQGIADRTDIQSKGRPAQHDSGHGTAIRAMDS